MGEAIKPSVQWRWEQTLRAADTFADDLGILGAWVGPRKGPDKRSQGQKEDYVLRRLLVAFKIAGSLNFPLRVLAEKARRGEPDFRLVSPGGETLGLEITEAGEEDYQAWLSTTEVAREEGSHRGAAPLDASTPRTADAVLRAIAGKVEKYEKGFYHSVPVCDLVVYDNTAWGGFLDKRELLNAIGRPNQLLGRFRRIHLVSGGIVFIDLFGSEPQRVDVWNTYEIDYAAWVFDQVERMRHGATKSLDLANIAEELESLGRSERNALRSHIQNLLLHLLKWQFQPAKRGSSWKISISLARDEIFEALTEMPSLRGDLNRMIAAAYGRARKAAAKETKLDIKRFPETCPYEPKSILDPEFLPDADRKVKS
jgi:hypothetical protein